MGRGMQAIVVSSVRGWAAGHFARRVWGGAGSGDCGRREQFGAALGGEFGEGRRGYIFRAASSAAWKSSSVVMAITPGSGR